MKRVLRVFVFAAASASVFALAQDYPSRAVRLLVPNAPGSSIDTMSRIVAAKLGDALGQSVFVENRDGAGGLIGVETGKSAKPDGYTLICASNGSMLIAPLLKKNVPYDAVRDFEHFRSFAGMPFVKNGRLRAIGQSLPRRSAMLGDIPPVADTVAGYDFSGWAGLVAPKGTPQSVIDKLHAALMKTLDLAEVKDGLAKQGAEVFTGSPEDFRKFLAQDQANTVKVIKAAQLQPE